MGAEPPTGTAQVLDWYERARDQLVTAAIAVLPDAASPRPPSYAALAPVGSLVAVRRSAAPRTDRRRCRPSQRDRVAARRSRDAGGRPRPDRSGRDAVRDSSGYAGRAGGMIARHGQHVGVAGEVEPDLQIALLRPLQLAVEEDPLRARVAATAEHVPYVDVRRRPHRGSGVVEDVAVPPPSHRDGDGYDSLSHRMDGEGRRREADQVVNPARNDRVEERALRPRRGCRGGQEQACGN